MTSLSYKLNSGASRTVSLPGGGSVTYRTPTTPSFEAAKAAARRNKAAMLADDEQLRGVGITAEDLAHKDVTEGLYTGCLIAELGVRHITAWDGVADETGEKAAEVTPENIRKLMSHPQPAQAFYADVLRSLLPDIVLKKDSGTDALGISAAVPPIAEDAQKSTPPAPEECEAIPESCAPTSSTG